MAICSWLISQNATQLVGPLQFLITFKCFSEGELDYAWSTGIHKQIIVTRGIANGEAVVEEYADILERWRQEFGSGSSAPDVDLEGYATEQWVKAGYQPKGNYLTQVPDGYAKTADIPTKVSQFQNDKGYLTAAELGGETVSKEQIEQAVNAYLDENPVSGGGSEEWEHICDIDVVEDTENPVNVIAQDLGAEYRKLQIIINKNSAGGIVTNSSSTDGVVIHANSEWNPGKVATFPSSATSMGWTIYIADIEYHEVQKATISQTTIGVDIFRNHINTSFNAPMEKLWFRGSGFKTFTINIYGVRA